MLLCWSFSFANAGLGMGRHNIRLILVRIICSPALEGHPTMLFMWVSFITEFHLEKQKRKNKLEILFIFIHQFWLKQLLSQTFLKNTGWFFSHSLMVNLYWPKQLITIHCLEKKFFSFQFSNHLFKSIV